MLYHQPPVQTLDSDSSAGKAEALHWPRRPGAGLTDGHEGLGGGAGPGHAHGVDCVDPHLVDHALDHAPRLVAQLPQQVKVQPHPPVALLLLALQDVP